MMQAGIYGEYKWIGVGAAGFLAIVAMMLTGTVHPPGGATAITCVMSGYGSAANLVLPVMFGVAVMMAIAYCANYAKNRFSGKEK